MLADTTGAVRVEALRGRDAWRHCGHGTRTGPWVRTGSRAGPVQEARAGGTQGGRARMCVRVARSVGRLTGWFDLWVQVIHTYEYTNIYIYRAPLFIT
jgi:hypothetical protein